jgi:hypothetical protein
MAFPGRNTHTQKKKKKILTTKLLNKLTSLNMSHTKMKQDTGEKILNYNRAIGILNEVLKPNLSEIHTKL